MNHPQKNQLYTKYLIVAFTRLLKQISLFLHGPYRGLVKLHSTYHDKLKTLDYLRSASEIISSNSCDGVRCISTLRISISSSLEDKCTHKTISNWLASSCKTWAVEGFAQTIICHFAFIWAWALSINTCPWPEASQ